MPIKIKTILFLCSIFAFQFSKAQNSFAESLRRLIGRSMVEKRNVYNEFSEIVFIEYKLKGRKIEVRKSGNSIYVKAIEEIISNKRISQFIKDSAKVNFLLPVYFSVDHDEKDWKWGDDALLFSRSGVKGIFALLSEANKGIKEIFEPLIVAPTFNGRKTQIEADNE
ncbi:hypothetical protein [Sediminibacterium soli]|uniref:hypothetical protein n=1 Tax=Sediminibacterium soli TaxID=2698829 RepID=UPI00137A0668|nr:hypothetical protein [Sediminibacterium soli]NCI45275.1 hypothetical protein [Sediminibacterium soli]